MYSILRKCILEIEAEIITKHLLTFQSTNRRVRERHFSLTTDHFSAISLLLFKHFPNVKCVGFVFVCTLTPDLHVYEKQKPSACNKIKINTFVTQAIKLT